jgi:hypothetical protein
MITILRCPAVLGPLLLALAVPGLAQTPASTVPTMSAIATGSFEVTLAPQPTGAGPGVARMSIDKQFHADLEATSKGEMLSAMGAVDGSAGYVAIEKVTGTLHGRRGSFVLQHSGTMDRGAPSLSVTVVPDSGTDELVGLTGRMDIIIGGGKHSYRFDYQLP